MLCLCSLIAGVLPDGREIEMQLGPEIKIDGKRPEWLKGDEKIGIVWWNRERWDNLDTPVDCVHGWDDSIKAIMLPGDHWYYQRSKTIKLITRIEAYEDGLDIPTLEKLGLLAEETLLEKFARENPYFSRDELNVVRQFIEWQEGK